MEIIERIKELEAQAKESEIWKSKTLNLREEVKAKTEALKKIIAELDSIFEINIKKIAVDKSDYYVSKSMIPVAEELYIRLKSTDGLEIGSKEIKSCLEKHKLNPCPSYLTGVRILLKKNDGVVERRDGKSTFFFYEHRENPNAIKFGNVGVLG